MHAQVGFDFTAHISAVCDDMVRRLPELNHIDMSLVGVGFSQSRKPSLHGLFASLTPLRFAGGATHSMRRGRKYTIQPVEVAGRQMLYLLRFALPRFLDLPLDEKLITVVHELWHISPKFDGDLRRFGGRCYAHGHSRKGYDEHSKKMVDRWLALSPPETLYDFLKLNFRSLHGIHGRIFGRKIASPKLLPMP
jgi:hypothetical protein